jgi:hypothetical protein
MPLYVYLQGGILSNAGQTPIATQAAGLMQSSIPVTQQPLPVYRPGVHLSHYPPNYIPYGHYFSPFYVPPPAMHQFLGNGAFPQQPQGSTIYPPPPNVSAPGIKYPLPQYKPGTNAENLTHHVMPNAFGLYGSSPAGYNLQRLPGIRTLMRISVLPNSRKITYISADNRFVTFVPFGLCHQYVNLVNK